MRNVRAPRARADAVLERRPVLAAAHSSNRTHNLLDAGDTGAMRSRTIKFVASVRRARLPFLPASGRAAWIATALLLAVHPMAVADDGYAEMGLGGLISLAKTDKVAMKAESLEISPRLVKVTLDFENLTQSRMTFPVIFPMPTYTTETPGFSWAGMPGDFDVRVDGRKASFRTRVRALDCGFLSQRSLPCKDVTKSLKAVGLTDRQIALFPVASPFKRILGAGAVPGLTPPQKKALRKMLLVREDGPWQQDKPLEPPPYPTWAVEVSYLWQMTLSARSMVRVEHQYAPFASGGSAGYLNEQVLRKEFCADDSFIDAWKKLPASGPYSSSETPVGGVIVQYVLTSANTWSGPIQDFTLRLLKDAPDELIAACFPAPFHEDSNALEVRVSNFAPKRNLRVVFFNLPAQAVPDGPVSRPPILD